MEEQKIVRKMDTSRPYLFIVAGPTGSGKSRLVDKIITYLEIKTAGDTIFSKIVIDSLVENSKGYKKHINNIINNNCQGNTGNVLKGCDILDEKINALNSELLGEFSSAYFTSRTDFDCISGEKLPDNGGSGTKSKSCDNVNNNNFQKGLTDKNNIIFETTGEWYPDWIFKKFNKELQEYNIVMAWSFAAINTLIDRNKGRAIHDMNKYIKSNGKGSAPRLPDVRTDKYRKSVIKIKETFEEMMKKCGLSTRDYDFSVNPDCAVRFLVFNNTTRGDGTDTIIYDSFNSNKTLSNISKINSLLFKPVQIPLRGGKKRKKSFKNKRTRKKRKRKGKVKRKQSNNKRKTHRKKRKTYRRKKIK